MSKRNRDPIREPPMADSKEPMISDDASESNRFTFGIEPRIKVKSSMSDNMVSHGYELELDAKLLVNSISLNVHPDFPAIIVQIGDRSHIHRALNLSSSPIPQATDEHSSLVAFRAWLLSPVLEGGFSVDSSESGNIRIFGARGFTVAESLDIIFNRWFIPAWMVEVKSAIAGNVLTVLSITNDFDTNDTCLTFLTGLSF
jgi:hypothetical protein